MEQEHRFFVTDIFANDLNQVVRIAVAQKQVKIAVVVIVEKLSPQPLMSRVADAIPLVSTLIIKSLIAVILVQRVHFVVDVGDEKAHPAVFVEISRVQAHAGAWATGLAVRDSGLRPDFLELSSATIDVQKVLHGIVGNKQVDEAVVVNVGCNHSPGFTQVIADS